MIIYVQKKKIIKMKILCYYVILSSKINTKKRDTQKSVSPKSGVDDGDRTHDPQDHNLIL